MSARRLLEEAVEAIATWRNGFSYMLPIAELELANLVWSEDGVRARRLAARARDGFARLGPLRDPERLEAASWLAAPP